jgi:hypothetical protein
MPNHIQSVLYVEAQTREELDLFLNTIKGEDEVIDFNKIVPMPKEIMETESSTSVDDALAYYLKMNNKEEEIKNFNKFRFSSFYPQEKIDKMSEQEKADLLNVGERYYNIFKTYGYLNWYDWSLANWGTKWNAYESCMNEPTEKSVTIYFQTAWSGVPMLVSMLVEKFPNLGFQYKFADEDRGYNCGIGQGNNGEFEFDYLEGGSDDAYETYRECWGYDESEFFKGKDGSWHFIDEYEEEENA